MADREIQFGEVERVHYQQHLPPNCNKQYAVVQCGSPDAGDLPVFVDLDAMRDMETHARTDTRVELGGVLLGGQYEDEQGRPFVVVADSLRAQHYEATKGSFKFTHDTWSEITRQRDEFPEDLRMVGWYHTHPDWGVFLSGMDLFICDNFFSSELDVALVIDPCRGHRGWFQWTGQTDDRIRPTGGFHLFTSRHRKMELELFSAHLENRPMATNDPRFGGYPPAVSPYPWPVATGSDSRQFWVGIATIGMLATQFFLLALLAWRILAPAAEEVADGKVPQGQAAQTVDRRTDRLDEIESKSQQVQAQLRVLDQVVGELGRGTPEGIVDLLQDKQQQIDTLQSDARVYRALEARVKVENDALSRTLGIANADRERLSERVGELKTTVADQKLIERQYQSDMAVLKKRLKAYEDPDEAAGLTARLGKPENWLWAGVGAIVGALVLACMLAYVPKSRGEAGADEDGEREIGEEKGDHGKEPAQRTNNDTEP